MRQRYLLLLMFLVFAACTAKQEPQAETSNSSSREDATAADSVPIASDQAEQPSKVDTAKARAFISLFKPLNPKGYHAYSPEFGSDLNVLTKQFKGVAIDAKHFQDVLTEEAIPYRESILKGFGGLFALGKFDIDERYQGLIARQHSQYSDTQIALLLWDKRNNKLTKGLELADSFGDAGWYFDTESWVTDFAPNEKLVIVSRTKDYTPNEDFTAGTVTDTLKMSRFTGNGFKTKVTTSLDTSRFKLKRWKQIK